MRMFSEKHSSLIRSAAVLLIAAFFGSGEAPAATPTPAEILTKLRARRDAVENLYVEATWEEFEKNAPSAWEEGLICSDKTGRIRVRYYHGKGALNAGPKHLVNNVYNGEITVSLREDPTRNRLGIPPEPDEKLDGRNHYRAALVHKGNFHLHTHRNPLSDISETLLCDLSALTATGRKVTVESVKGQQEVYELRYHLDPKDDPEHLEHRVLVDAGKGWVVTRHEALLPNGKSAFLNICEYGRSESGLWLPTKGRLVNFGEKEIPNLDWRFTVRRAVVNNPKFDPSVFDVKLSTGVYVNDTRHDVSYTLEKDITSSADLNRLTAETLAVSLARQAFAREEAKKNPPRKEKKPSSK